jgi:hypothetical protein
LLPLPRRVIDVPRSLIVKLAHLGTTMRDPLEYPSVPHCAAAGAADAAGAF